MQVSEALEVRGGQFRCMKCSQGLGSATGNYKLSCVSEQVPVSDANPHIGDPKRYVDAALVLRRYYCPGCGVQLEADVTTADAAPVWDIELAPGAGE